MNTPVDFSLDVRRFLSFADGFFELAFTPQLFGLFAITVTLLELLLLLSRQLGSLGQCLRQLARAGRGKGQDCKDKREVYTANTGHTCARVHETSSEAAVELTCIIADRYQGTQTTGPGHRGRSQPNEDARCWKKGDRHHLP
jgi:hypothetical protein